MFLWFLPCGHLYHVKDENRRFHRLTLENIKYFWLIKTLKVSHWIQTYKWWTDDSEKQEMNMMMKNNSRFPPVWKVFWAASVTFVLFLFDEINVESF